MKIFTALLGTETNTFSPFLTGLANFEQTCLFRHGEYSPQPYSFVVPLIRWRDMAHARGWTVVESLAAFAQPAGITLRSVYESFRDEILADLRAAMPVDAVLLNMHGAMVAEGYDNCEGDLVQRVREAVGPNVPIGVELDLHCHLTQNLVANANAIITFKEYPHTDPPERAVDLFDIIAGALVGKYKPVTTLHDLKMIGVFHTSRQPMRAFVDHMQELEDRDGVLSVSLGHGFPWGDVPEMGTRVLVVTDNRPDEGARLARELGEQFYAMREAASPPYETINGALDKALAFEGMPVVLADVSDNAGGGAPNDSTFILRRILERGISNAAVGCIWDPVVVSVALETGEGVTTDLRIGGKMGPMSGDPLDLRVRIGKIARHATQPFAGGTSQMGDAVALHAANGIDIVVNSNRTQTFSPQVFTNVGIDPAQKKILVVKSMQHFYAAFEPVMQKTLYVAAPGALVPDFKQLPYRKARQAIWPLA
jgi:microcystin degradation protein MlrC